MTDKKITPIEQKFIRTISAFFDDAARQQQGREHKRFRAMKREATAVFGARKGARAHDRIRNVIDGLHDVIGRHDKALEQSRENNRDARGALFNILVALSDESQNTNMMEQVMARIFDEKNPVAREKRVLQNFGAKWRQHGGIVPGVTKFTA